MLSPSIRKKFRDDSRVLGMIWTWIEGLGTLSAWREAYAERQDGKSETEGRLGEMHPVLLLSTDLLFHIHPVLQS